MDLVEDRQREVDRLEAQREEVLNSVSIRPRDKHVLLLQIHEKTCSLLNLDNEVFLPKEAKDLGGVAVRRIVIQSVPAAMQPEEVNTIEAEEPTK